MNRGWLIGGHRNPPTAIRQLFMAVSGNQAQALLLGTARGPGGVLEPRTRQRHSATKCDQYQHACAEGWPSAGQGHQG